MNNTAWVHNMSPFLIQFTDTIGIRYYGLAYLAGFFLAYYFNDLMAKRGTILLSREQVPDFITYIAIGALAGGRLGYALFYAPDLFTQFHSGFPFWGLLEVNKGGMASHGGMLGVVTACILFGFKNKVGFFHIADSVCIGAAQGIFFGRMGNFINGELYGREAPATFAWAVKFPLEIYTWGVNELDKIRQLGPAAVALNKGITLDQWSNWVSSFGAEAQRNVDALKEAMVLATQKHDSAVIEALRPVLTPRYPSQLIQAVLEGLLVFLVLAWLWRKPRKPGVIAVTFGFLYACARIVGEQFRLPDHDIGYQALGLTRGQWLSVAMFTGVAIYAFFILRRPGKPIGGWGSSKSESKT